MLAHIHFVKEKPVLQPQLTSETYWYFTYGIALLMLVLLVNQGIMLEENSEVTSITNSESLSDAADIPTTKLNEKKITTALKQRIAELSLEGRIRVSNPKDEPVTISINTGLLFSEGDSQLSRAGSFALRSLMENAGFERENNVTIILEKRKDTPVEFTYGKELTELEKERELVLQQFLSGFQVSAGIRQ
jgi:hypothetical protein